MPIARAPAKPAARGPRRRVQIEMFLGPMMPGRAHEELTEFCRDPRLAVDFARASGPELLANDAVQIGSAEVGVIVPAEGRRWVWLCALRDAAAAGVCAGPHGRRQRTDGR